VRLPNGELPVLQTASSVTTRTLESQGAVPPGPVQLSLPAALSAEIYEIEIEPLTRAGPFAVEVERGESLVLALAGGGTEPVLTRLTWNLQVEGASGNRLQRLGTGTLPSHFVIAYDSPSRGLINVGVGLKSHRLTMDEPSGPHRTQATHFAVHAGVGWEATWRGLQTRISLDDYMGWFSGPDEGLAHDIMFGLGLRFTL
jgi:hypothetical protein